MLIRHILALFVTISFISCNPDEIMESPDQIQEESYDDRIQTVLGESKSNPFTIDNIRAALAKLEEKNSKGNNRLNCVNCELNLGPTHKYVKFMPQNLDQMVLLETSGYNIWDVPLDQDLGLVGDYYHDPAVGPDGITYFYSLIPVQYPITLNVPYQVISEVFLYNEDDGDIQDEQEVDPWDPNICYDEFGVTYICGGLKIQLVNNTVNATKTLNDMGVDKLELYNIAMELSGNQEEIIPIEKTRNENQRIQSISGSIKVRDNSINVDVPVRNVLIKTRRWFKLYQTYTLNSGSFSIPGTYRKKATVSVHFNAGDKIRGINNLWKFYQFVIPVSKTIGEFTTSQLSNVNYIFQYNSNANSNAATQWVAAHTWNTAQDNDLKNSQYGINYVSNFNNIWISSRITSPNGSAPMLRGIANSSVISSGIDLFLAHTTGPIGVAAKQIIQQLLPDITLRYGSSSSSTMFTKDIVETIYHELGHSTHYTYVGSGYWTEFISYIVSNGGYGTKATNGSGRIAVAEAWGFYIGKLYSSQYYGQFVGNTNALQISQNFRFQLENQKPSDTSNPQYWIPYGMYYDLTDTGEPTSTLVIDNVNGYTPKRIFESINSNVITVNQFRNDLLSRHGNIQSAQVNQIVQSYGY